MEDREIKDLEKSLEQIWEVAQKLGLDPFPTRFEIVPASVMYESALMLCLAATLTGRSARLIIA